MNPRLARDWPIVGRDDELSNLEKSMVDGDCAGVILAGPSGVGKTRLAVECLAIAERLGLATARVPATQPLSNVPFGSIALFPSYEKTDCTPNPHRVDLVRQAAATLVDGAGGRRLVMLVDDAQFLDAMSAAVIQQLAVTKAAFVLATERSGMSSPEPIVALWKDRILDRTELRPLEHRSLCELLERVLGGQVDPAAVYKLSRRSQGNMLFLREMVLGALDSGTLVQDMGVWHLSGLVTPPDRLVGLVQARLRGLEADERDLLELISIMEPLGGAELGALSNRDTAEALEAKGLVVSSAEGSGLAIRFAHPLYGDVVRATMPALRRQRLARSLADLVESSAARTREDLLHIGTLRVISGGGDPATMLAAAMEARWTYDFPLAERLARQAVELGAGFQARLLTAQVAGLQGRAAEADAILVALSGDADTDAERGEVAIMRLDHAIWGPNPSGGAGIADEAMAQLSDPQWRAEVAGRHVALLGLLRGPNESASAAKELVDTTSGRVLAKACMTMAIALARQGLAEASLAASERGLQEQLTLAEPLDVYPWIYDMNRCEALAAAGRLHEYEAHAREKYAEALKQGSIEQQAFFSWYVARSAIERGRVNTAVQHAREAVALFHEIDRPLWMRCSLGLLAAATALAGHASESVETSNQYANLACAATKYMATDMLRAQAWAAIVDGRESNARAKLLEAADLGEQIGDRVGAAHALHDLVRLGRPKNVCDRLDALAAAVDGELVKTMAAHGHALHRNRPDDLDAVSRQFERLGADLLAADASAQAAIVWSEAGERRRSAAADRRVAVLLERCEGAKTPATLTVGEAALLSPAERDTAVLAAAGHSNKAIAQELFVSVRTVETRLNHVYLKLGITGRQGLAAVFRAE